MGQGGDSFITIDPRSLPDHFDAERIEKRAADAWEKSGIYRYDAARPRDGTFVVDTPPPTVSGSLHVGHVFSFTHTDIQVRYERMRGKNIFYPMGWDDNGLPTERRVQNYFHVRCDPRLPYEPGLAVEPADAARRAAPARLVSRRNFIELCRSVTGRDEQAFQELWRRVGLSVDWTETYATIGERSRRIAQLSFLDLYEKGHLYNREEPTMWDVDFRTAVAQAEVEDRPVSGAWHRLTFGVEGQEHTFTVATTRPELLPACVGVATHPSDERYRDLVGRRAVTPLFGAPVPIFASDRVDPTKGTGILMVCTFGDSSDVQWWREMKLELRQVIGKDGRFLDISFGTPGWPSGDPAAAYAACSRLRGKKIPEARKEMVALLKERAALTGDPEPLQHQVNFYEKGEHPLELITTRQWFVRLLDKKELLRDMGNRVTWHPDHMRLRYLNWTENLQFDWCVSRQRFFGVPFPVWYHADDAGSPDFDRPILADASRLPVDPLSDAPPGMPESARGRPGGFVGESDVFDTWFTSSMTPQIATHGTLDPERHHRLFPMDLRPQAHDIIRTWAFYTIAKSALHEGSIPWKHIVLSGWILDPDRKKMSKSKGNVVTPMEYLRRHTSDGVRYWAGCARLGTDTTFDEKVLQVGKRLVTKIYNAGKFVLSQAGQRSPIQREIDRAFAARLGECVQRASDAFERFDFARALADTETFFWGSFTDSYIELVKGRARSASAPGAGAEARDSAVACLRLALGVLLRLFAPFLPYVTEEVWSWAFARETSWNSIHTASWPGRQDFQDVAPPSDPDSFDAAASALSAIHRHKTLSGLSVGGGIERVTLAANPRTIAAIRLSLDDLTAAARARACELVEKPEMPDLQVEVVQAQSGKDIP